MSISEPIAIIGMACRFPGAADVNAFWDLLKNGGDAVTEIPAERWNWRDFYDESAEDPHKTYSRWGGFINDIDKFDAPFFDISPREARLMDPQQRLFLETTWRVFEDAGLPLEAVHGQKIGVFVGGSNNTYYHALLPELTKEDHAAGVGNLTAIIPNRVSYYFKLKGPSVFIDTLCSSSLVALHTACQSIRNGECESAVVGGINLLMSPQYYAGLSRMKVHAPDGRCKPFSSKANGIVLGEGVGVILIKPLSRAQADGDQVHAVVHGSAVNHGGETNGLTAPNPSSQAEVISAALSAAGVSADEISYVEAHGTGTMLGDPIEVQGLTRAFRQFTARKQFCHIGSVKSNIGHLEPAAGIAQVIKVALAIKHRVIPPTLHTGSLNPLIAFQTSPFKVADQLIPWDLDTNRLAGVSSFGMGGTNAHAVIGEYSPTERITNDQWPPQENNFLLMSAKSRGVLDAMAQQYADWIGKSEVDTSTLCRVHNLRKNHFENRIAVFGQTNMEIADALRKYVAGENPSQVFQRGENATASSRKVVFMFSGQGTHPREMFGYFYGKFAPFKMAFEACEEILIERCGYSLKGYLLENREGQNTALYQPALFVFEYCLYQLWSSLGVRPSFVIGHSIGEYAAACAAGIFSLESTLILVTHRGRCTTELAPPGRMLAVYESADKCLKDSDRVFSAAFNAPGLTVIAGDVHLMTQFANRIAEGNIKTQWLTAEHPFHTPLLEPVARSYNRIADQIEYRSPLVPIVSTVTGKFETNAMTTADYWSQQIVSPVMFSQGIQQLIDRDADIFIEIGPDASLTALGKMAFPSGETEWNASCRNNRLDGKAFTQSVLKLFVGGLSINWNNFYGSPPLPHISLPTYSFNKQKYWYATDRERKNDNHTGQSQRRVVGEHATGNVASAIASMISELLELPADQISRSTPFMELGADSLVLITLLRKVEKRFGLTFTIKQLFDEVDTVERMSAFIGNHQTVPTDVVVPVADGNAKEIPLQRIGNPIFGGGRSSDLDDSHQDFLRDFTEKYTSKTLRSKMLTQENRNVLADNRASAAFRLSTKELLYPIVAERSSGAKITDIDGNEYVDIAMGFGVNFFGHQPPFLTDALTRQLELGIQLGPQTKLAGDVARLICDLSGLERASFHNSGTEAVMTALRLARTVTGRSKIAFFEGSYHGHFDGTLGIAKNLNETAEAQPMANGVTHGVMSESMVLDYDNPRSIELIEQHADELAAVIVEPVQSRRPYLQPAAFLRALREVTTKHGIALVFDEMITGFRVHAGGAQAHFGVQADMATYGKIIGGGMPIGVVAGAARFMDGLDGGAWIFGDRSFPQVKTTFFAGTFCKHPLALAASKAVLLHLKASRDVMYAGLNARTKELADGLNAFFEQEAVPIRIGYFGSQFFFHCAGNIDIFFYLLVHKGVYVWEGRTCFLSTAHTTADIDFIASVVREAALECKRHNLFKGIAPINPDRFRNERKLSYSLSEEQIKLAEVASFDRAASAAFNESQVVRLSGKFNYAYFVAALNEVVSRHEALRTHRFFEKQQEVRIYSDVEVPLRKIEGSVSEARATADKLIRELASANFDLSEGPFIRCTILQTDTDEHLVVMVVHHLIADGWSLEVMWSEMSALYSSKVNQATSALETPTQFRTFIDWQRQFHDRAKYAASYSFWKQQLANAGDAPMVSKSFSTSANGGLKRISIDAGLREKLQLFARSTGNTVYATLTTALALLIHKLDGKTGVNLAIPISGQMQMNANTLLGQCVLMFPLITTIDPMRSLSEQVKHTRNALVQVLEHQSCSMESLIQEDPTISIPDLDVVIDMNNIKRKIEFAGLETTFLPPPVLLAKYSLSVSIFDFEGEMFIDFLYKRDLFSDSLIAAWTNYFQNIIRSIVDDPDIQIRSLDVMGEVQRAKRFAAWNNA